MPSVDLPITMVCKSAPEMYGVSRTVMITELLDTDGRPCFEVIQPGKTHPVLYFADEMEDVRLAWWLDAHPTNFVKSGSPYQFANGPTIRICSQDTGQKHKPFLWVHDAEDRPEKQYIAELILGHALKDVTGKWV